MNLRPSLEEVEHTADRAFCVRGQDLAELLGNAARAMVALDGEPPYSERFIRRVIEVDGSDRETAGELAERDLVSGTNPP